MCNTIYDMRFRRSGFTLVEILIVVAILGILAAITIPAFQGHVLEARESAAKANLQILRNVIEVYAAQHDGIPPGYRNGDPSDAIANTYLTEQLIETGNYLSDFPKNPFNNYKLISLVQNGQDFPTEPTPPEAPPFGWIYKAETRNIRLNYEGTDKNGIRYFDY